MAAALLTVTACHKQKPPPVDPAGPPATVYYSVTFEPNGGGAVDKITVTAGNGIAASPVTARAGYTFGGWFAASDLSGGAVSFPYTPAQDVTLYAKWVPEGTASYIPYTVHFNTADGSAVPDRVSDTVTGKVAKPANPTKADNTFVDWYTDITYTAVFDFSAVITAETTAYAKWEPLPPIDTSYTEYVVTFNTDNGSAIAPAKNSTLTGKVARPADPTKQGYLFRGWFSNPEKTTAFVFDTIITQNTTLYAKWEAEPSGTFTPYDVYFNTGTGGSVVFAQRSSAATGTVTRPSPNPTRAGYTFIDWYTDASYTTVFTFSAVITAETTLVAGWDPLPRYKIRFVFGAGASDYTEVETPNGGGTVFAPWSDPVKEGYPFAGWFSEENGAGTQFSSGTVFTAPATFYAHFISVDGMTQGGMTRGAAVTLTVGTSAEFYQQPNNYNDYYRWFVFTPATSGVYRFLLVSDQNALWSTPIFSADKSEDDQPDAYIHTDSFTKMTMTAGTAYSIRVTAVSAIRTYHFVIEDMGTLPPPAVGSTPQNPLTLLLDTPVTMPESESYAWFTPAQTGTYRFTAEATVPVDYSYIVIGIVDGDAYIANDYSYSGSYDAFRVIAGYNLMSGILRLMMAAEQPTPEQLAEWFAAYGDYDPRTLTLGLVGGVSYGIMTVTEGDTDSVFTLTVRAVASPAAGESAETARTATLGTTLTIPAGTPGQSFSFVRVTVPAGTYQITVPGTDYVWDYNDGKPERVSGSLVLAAGTYVFALEDVAAGTSFLIETKVPAPGSEAATAIPLPKGTASANVAATYDGIWYVITVPDAKEYGIRVNKTAANSVVVRLYGATGGAVNTAAYRYGYAYLEASAARLSDMAFAGEWSYSSGGGVTVTAGTYYIYVYSSSDSVFNLVWDEFKNVVVAGQDEGYPKAAALNAATPVDAMGSAYFTVEIPEAGLYALGAAIEGGSSGSASLTWSWSDEPGYNGTQGLQDGGIRITRAGTIVVTVFAGYSGPYKVTLSAARSGNIPVASIVYKGGIDGTVPLGSPDTAALGEPYTLTVTPPTIAGYVFTYWEVRVNGQLQMEWGADWGPYYIQMSETALTIVFTAVYRGVYYATFVPRLVDTETALSGITIPQIELTYYSYEAYYTFFALAPQNVPADYEFDHYSIFGTYYTSGWYNFDSYTIVYVEGKNVTVYAYFRNADNGGGDNGGGESGSSGGFSYTIGANGITITAYTGNQSAVTIPGEIAGQPVVAIGDGVFHNNGNVTYVFIPQSVTYIAHDAFADAGKLLTVEFEEGSQLSVIADHAFVRLPAGSIVLPVGIDRIEDYAFEGTNLIIHFDGTVAQWQQIDIAGDAFIGATVTVDCTDGSLHIGGGYNNGGGGGGDNGVNRELGGAIALDVPQTGTFGENVEYQFLVLEAGEYNASVTGDGISWWELWFYPERNSNDHEESAASSGDTAWLGAKMYYAKLRHNGGGTATLTIFAVSGGGGDNGLPTEVRDGNYESPHALTVGIPYSGYDTDGVVVGVHFVFTVESGGTYYILAEQLAGEDPVLVQIYDANFDVIQPYPGFITASGSVQLNAGTYFLRFVCQKEGISNPFPYRITVSDEPIGGGEKTDDSGNADSPIALSLELTHTGEINGHGAAAWFTFVVPADGSNSYVRAKQLGGYYSDTVQVFLAAGAPLDAKTGYVEVYLALENLSAGTYKISFVSQKGGWFPYEVFVGNAGPVRNWSGADFFDSYEELAFYLLTHGVYHTVDAVAGQWLGDLNTALGLPGGSILGAVMAADARGIYEMMTYYLAGEELAAAVEAQLAGIGALLADSGLTLNGSVRVGFILILFVAPLPLPADWQTNPPQSAQALHTMLLGAGESVVELGGAYAAALGVTEQQLTNCFYVGQNPAEGGLLVVYFDDAATAAGVNAEAFIALFAAAMNLDYDCTYTV
ncbi:MAG: InlB B-repeat-containing protein, partial [Clostridiales bacterium]|nr:InlB B-repeat-containing protein [Clostridiales bacterium]